MHVDRDTLQPEQLWHDEYQQEHDFNALKYGIAVKEAFEENSLLPHEQYEGLPNDVADLQSAEHKADVKRRRTNAAKSLSPTLFAVPKFGGMHVYVESCTAIPPQVAFERAGCWGMVQTEALSQSQVIVVQSVSKISHRVALAACLMGCMVINSTFYLHGPQTTGASCLAFVAALSKRRWLHISSGFVAEHPLCSGLVMDILDTFPGHHWKLVDQAVVVRKARRAPASAIAFVTRRERSTCAELQPVRDKVVLSEISVLLKHIDTSNSLLAQ